MSTAAQHVRRPHLPSWAVEIARPARGPVPWPGMILAAMAIGLPVAVGLAVGWPVEGVVAAAGALVGTGMVVAMLLAAVRTPLIAILDDYYLAVRTMNTRAARMGETALSSAVLERYCARARAEMMAFLDSPEVAAFRSSAPVDRLRERMTGPAVS